jgi:hypothetical protein
VDELELLDRWWWSASDPRYAVTSERTLAAAGIVYTLTMPFVALATVYVYFDMRVRDELSTDVESGELLAEIQLA